VSIRRNQRRKNKPWECRWVEEGTHFSRSFATRKEAESFDARRKSAANSGLSGTTSDEKLTVDDYAEKYLARRKMTSTVRTNRGAYEKYIKPRIGASRIQRVRHSALQDLVNEWSDVGLRPRTVRRYFTVLCGIFALAERDGVIVRIPTRGIDIPEPDEPHRYSMTPSEVSRVLDALHPNYRAFLYTLVETGMRPCEAIALDIGDFDWKERTLNIRCSKTRAGIRTIRISSTVHKLINEHLKTTGRTMANSLEPLFVSHRTNGDGLVTGTRIDSSNFRARIFKPAAAKAGLPDLQIYDSRRTSASTLVDNDAPPKVTQERMGHADIRTTMNHYVQASKKAHEDVVEQLEKVFNSQLTVPVRCATES
jgi:integrase